MSRSESLEEFREAHPYVDVEATPRLYRFKAINGAPDSHLEDLFINSKLYHPRPDQLNDPFECKPHFNWPTDAASARALRIHLARIMRVEGGHSWKTAKKLAAERMSDPGSTAELIRKTGLETYGELRVCSFTTSNENLLFWSHYGDSHRGMCLEFDSSCVPILHAQRVDYREDYPVAKFPPTRDETNLKPALVKSPAWSYEEEYRTIFTPGADVDLPNDGATSLFIETKALSGVYFGANTDEKDKERVLEYIRQGPFNPMIYETELGQSTFSLRFLKMEQDQ